MLIVKVVLAEVNCLLLNYQWSWYITWQQYDCTGTMHCLLDVNNCESGYGNIVLHNAVTAWTVWLLLKQWNPISYGKQCKWYCHSVVYQSWKKKEPIKHKDNGKYTAMCRIWPSVQCDISVAFIMVTWHCKEDLNSAIWVLVLHDLTAY